MFDKQRQEIAEARVKAAKDETEFEEAQQAVADLKAVEEAEESLAALREKAGISAEVVEPKKEGPVKYPIDPVTHLEVRPYVTATVKVDPKHVVSRHVIKQPCTCDLCGWCPLQNTPRKYKVDVFEKLDPYFQEKAMDAAMAHSVVCPNDKKAQMILQAAKQMVASGH